MHFLCLSGKINHAYSAGSRNFYIFPATLTVLILPEAAFFYVFPATLSTLQQSCIFFVVILWHEKEMYGLTRKEMYGNHGITRNF